MERTNRYSGLALYVLLVGATRHYGWDFFPPEMRGSVSKALGALATLAVLPLIYRLSPTRPMFLALAWWAWEETQTALCSVMYAARPWPVAVGQSICSARLDFDVGAVGILLLALVLWKITPVRLSRWQDDRKEPK